jgi:hypothetical protein
VRILAGSDDALRIWLNGELVHQKFDLRGPSPDQDEATVLLPAGESSLLVEVSQSFGMWGLYLRFEDEAGQPLRLTDEGSLEPIGGEP